MVRLLTLLDVVSGRVLDHVVNLISGSFSGFLSTTIVEVVHLLTGRCGGHATGISVGLITRSLSHLLLVLRASEVHAEVGSTQVSGRLLIVSWRRRVLCLLLLLLLLLVAQFHELLDQELGLEVSTLWRSTAVLRHGCTGSLRRLDRVPLQAVPDLLHLSVRTHLLLLLLHLVRLLALRLVLLLHRLHHVHELHGLLLVLLLLGHIVLLLESHALLVLRLLVVVLQSIPARHCISGILLSSALRVCIVSQSLLVLLHAHLLLLLIEARVLLATAHVLLFDLVLELGR